MILAILLYSHFNYLTEIHIIESFIEVILFLVD
ncbi:MAG: hypothetical protein K0S61_3922 [Anaerocolumna sp.]|jgi:hypothetical protein|nr:hypothetical protein [Anaerocolumna sp.]